MSAAQWTPKVHPLSREMEADDPMELVAEPAPGDPNVMFECIVQEFAWMGWERDQILALFHDPNYPVLNQLRELFGENEIRSRLAGLTAAVGVMRVSETIDDEPDSDEPELIQLHVRQSACSGGSSDA